VYIGTFATISNREDWNFTVELTEAETGDVVDLTGVAVDIALRAAGDTTALLTGDIDDGHVSIVGDPIDGIFTVTFTETEVSVLCAKTYEVGIRLTNPAGDMSQLFIGTLPVLDGIVSI